MKIVVWLKCVTWSSTLTDCRSFHSSIVCARSTMHSGTLKHQTMFLNLLKQLLYFLLFFQLFYLTCNHKHVLVYSRIWMTVSFKFNIPEAVLVMVFFCLTFYIVNLLINFSEKFLFLVLPWLLRSDRVWRTCHSRRQRRPEFCRKFRCTEPEDLIWKLLI